MSRYTEFTELDSGGDGSFQTCVDTELKRFATLKIFRNKAAYEAELAVVAELRKAQHPNIVTFWEVGPIEFKGNPCWYISMEELHRIPDILSVADVLTIGIEISAALAFLHEHSIVHADVKPANICRSTSGVYKLIDFGHARTPSGGWQARGVLGNSDVFVAPEIRRDQPPTSHADVYGLGMTLRSLAERIRAPASPPSQLIEVTDFATRGVPAHRPSMRDVHQSLDELRTETTNPSRETPRRRRQWPMIGMVAAIALVIVGGILLLSRRNDGGERRVSAATAGASTDGPPTPTSPPTPASAALTTSAPAAPAANPASSWSFTVRARFDSPGSHVNSVAWDGDRLWLSDNSSNVFKVDAASGAVLDVQATSHAIQHGLCRDAALFWVVDAVRRELFAFDATTGILSTSPVIALPGGSSPSESNHGLVCSGGRFWYSDGYKLYELERDGRVVRTVASAVEIDGLAFDGTQFVVFHGLSHDTNYASAVDSTGRFTARTPLPDLASVPGGPWQVRGAAWGRPGQIWLLVSDFASWKTSVVRLDVVAPGIT